MPVVRYNINCSFCNAKLSVNEMFGGTTQKCPHCNKPLRVPNSTQMLPENTKKYRKEKWQTEEIIILEKGQYIPPPWLKPVIITAVIVLALGITAVVVITHSNKKPAAKNAGIKQEESGKEEKQQESGQTEKTETGKGAGTTVKQPGTDGGGKTKPEAQQEAIPDFLAAANPYYRDPGLSLDPAAAPKDSSYNIDLVAQTINGQYLLGASPNLILRWMGKPMEKNDKKTDDTDRSYFTRESTLCYFKYYESGIKFIFGPNGLEVIEIDPGACKGEIAPLDPRSLSPNNFEEQFGNYVHVSEQKKNNTIIEYTLSNGRAIRLRWYTYRSPAKLKLIRFSSPTLPRRYYDKVSSLSCTSPGAFADSPDSAASKSLKRADVDVNISKLTFRGIPFSQLKPEGFFEAQYPEIHLFPDDNYIECSWITGKKVAAFPIRRLGIVVFFDEKCFVGVALGKRPPRFIPELQNKKLSDYGGSVGLEKAQGEKNPVSILEDKMGAEWTLYARGIKGDLAIWPAASGGLVVADLKDMTFVATVPAAEATAFRKWLTDKKNGYDSISYRRKGKRSEYLKPADIKDDARFPVTGGAKKSETREDKTGKTDEK